jgi:hypothetical protein
VKAKGWPSNTSVGRLGRGQALLGRTRRLQQHRNLRVGGLLEPTRVEHALRDGPVEVIAAQGRITAYGLHLEHPVDQLEHRDVEGAAT